MNIHPTLYRHPTADLYKPMALAGVVCTMMDTTVPGNVHKISQQHNALTITTQHAEARVWIYSPTIIRVNVSRHFDAQDHSFAVIQPPQGNIRYDDSPDELSIHTGELELRISKSPLRFNFYNADGILLSGDDERFGTMWQGEKFTNYRKLFKDERFIGLGEKTGNLDRRGSNYVNWNTDAVDYTPKSDPLYKTFPFYIGLHSGLTYGLFLDNTHRSFFDFGASTDHSMHWLGADGGDLNYYFFGAQGVANIIQDQTWLTGRMEMPPLWSLGYQQCRWSYMSAKEVLEVARNFRKLKIPADAMYCDIDYMDGFKIFTWNNETFPEPKAMIDELTAMGFKLVTIVDPGIKIEDGYKQYDEGVKKGYFATYPDGELYIGEVWPGRCHFPDFYKAEVRDWWGKSFDALTEPGVAGFWNDMNEPAAWGQNIPGIMRFGDKYMPEVRNAYGNEMSRGTYEGTKALLKGKRPFVLTRAAYTGIQRYSAVWTGDNTATDAHLLLGCRLVNSLGIVGVSYVGVDIGGFSGNPTPELMVRWNSLGVYTPMFRNHAMAATVMREPWAWGKQNEKIIKKDIEQRYKLLPYIYSSFYRSHQTGLPVARTLAIDLPFDELVYDEAYQNQFFFGDNILVAPADSHQREIDVYLPAGDWYRFGTDEKITGGDVISADAPLTDLPVFIRAGAIIPMQSIVQSTAEQGDGILQIHVWNGEGSTDFVYYEDDGDTYAYEQGAYYKRTISFNAETGNITFSAVEGTFTSRFDRIMIVSHGFGKTEDWICYNEPTEFTVR
ncbi:glycoside hydrolase family 31 protein [Mucilaginibacter myungsuensis]|nr:glycoside hydrolase family 31 protein [Mucilaginibacter myungsuensis]